MKNKLQAKHKKLRKYKKKFLMKNVCLKISRVKLNGIKIIMTAPVNRRVKYSNYSNWKNSHQRTKLSCNYCISIRENTNCTTRTPFQFHVMSTFFFFSLSFFCSHHQEFIYFFFSLFSFQFFCVNSPIVNNKRDIQENGNMNSTWVRCMMIKNVL